jgi:dihydroflavonol-4-reductase
VIVVTGGSGFVGSHLVRLLLARGEKVRIADRREPPSDIAPSAEFVPVDICDDTTLRTVFCDAKVVYHLAANPQLWAPHRGEFLRVNYWGTVHVLRAALRQGVRRIVHVSTESILTRRGQKEVIAETQDVSRGELIGPYCLSKWRAERYAWLLARAGAPVTIVNPTLPIGPGDWLRTPPTQMILDVCRGKRPAYVAGELNLIDVRDVALGLAAAAERPPAEHRYVLGGENWTIRQLFDTVARLAGVPPPRWRIPYPLALAIAYGDEFLSDLTGGPPQATVTGVKLTRRRMHFDTQRTWGLLRLQPRPVIQSLQEMIAWFREVRWLS